ncbi:MAG: hypothetical protein CO170_03560 [candidate division SR1 bacterium CG_4_9_14_3_um_filter_40_9]|nr:MAG: hypothetical protein CO170_03560 [candidate division SR1 bacterium CG_4_9_14_3_um_filter_40_9]
MGLTPELENICKALDTEKVVALLAPSFPVDFKFPEIILQLRQLGIDKVVELTYAAKLINMEYEKILKENPDKQYICANCPTIVTMIQAKYPELKDKLINVASPMVVMHRYIKKEYEPGYKTLFIGPCVAKKMEAKLYGIDYAITFQELQAIFDYNKENNIPHKQHFEIDVTEAGDWDFDKVYNDYTKIYPLGGGVAETMHLKGIATKDQLLAVDGPANVDEGFHKFKENSNIRFLDILMCNGGCVGGPGIVSKDAIEARVQRVKDYKEYCKKDKIGAKLGKFEYSEGLDITRTSEAIPA